MFDKLPKSGGHAHILKLNWRIIFKHLPVKITLSKTSFIIVYHFWIIKCPHFTNKNKWGLLLIIVLKFCLRIWLIKRQLISLIWLRRNWWVFCPLKMKSKWNQSVYFWSKPQPLTSLYDIWTLPYYMLCSTLNFTLSDTDPSLTWASRQIVPHSM